MKNLSLTIAEKALGGTRSVDPPVGGVRLDAAASRVFGKQVAVGVV
jgi:hypothetical protein